METEGAKEIALSNWLSMKYGSTLSDNEIVSIKYIKRESGMPDVSIDYWCVCTIEGDGTLPQWQIHQLTAAVEGFIVNTRANDSSTKAYSISYINKMLRNNPVDPNVNEAAYTTYSARYLNQDYANELMNIGNMQEILDQNEYVYTDARLLPYGSEIT